MIMFQGCQCLLAASDNAGSSTDFGAEKKGTGELIAQAATTTILDWKLQDQMDGISFETTASNTVHLHKVCFVEKN